MLVLFSYTRIYSAKFGITKRLVAGQDFHERGLVIYRDTPKYIGSRTGFDGQQYAEIALDPLLRDPQLKTALDSATYRCRRILMSWLAWLGGLGKPFWILNVYAGLNLIFWIGFSAMICVLFRPYGWGGLAGFAAMLLTCGLVESITKSLTDFPSFVLMTLAMMLGGGSGACVLALSALARDANIIGILGLWNYRPPWLATARHNLVLALIAGLPIALWSSYVISRFGNASDTLPNDNHTWPLQGIMAKLGEFSVDAVCGNIHWRKWYSEFYTNEALHALLTIVSTLTQCIYLLTHREWNNRIWRAGFIFIPYFLCISFISWELHFVVTRHALAITLAFNLILASRKCRGWIVWFLLGNCFVPYGIHLLTIESAEPPTGYSIVSAQPSALSVGLRFDRGWAPAEWTRKSTWRWGTARRSLLTLTNPNTHPMEVTMTFFVRSITSRDVKISVSNATLCSISLQPYKQSVTTPPFLIPTGETVIAFDTPTKLVRLEDGSDDRLLSFMIMDLRISLSVPRVDASNI